MDLQTGTRIGSLTIEKTEVKFRRELVKGAIEEWHDTEIHFKCDCGGTKVVWVDDVPKSAQKALTAMPDCGCGSWQKSKEGQKVARQAAKEEHERKVRAARKKRQEYEGPIPGRYRARKVVLNVSLDIDMVNFLDERAKKQNRQLSAVVAEAIRIGSANLPPEDEVWWGKS